jgi:hypothetical protein
MGSRLERLAFGAARPDGALMRQARKRRSAGYRADEVFGAPESMRSWLQANAAAGAWARLP